MNPPLFFGSKVNEDFQDFVYEFYKILHAMGGEIKRERRAKRLSTQDVTQTWYPQWKDNRAFIMGPISWNVFRRAFLDRFFSWDAKVEEFI